MCRTPVRIKNRQRVQKLLRIVPNVGTFCVMSKSPLREYLDAEQSSAERFAADKGLSPWSVRHWARGDKLPELASQIALEKATDGKVTPAQWLEWSLSRPTAPQADAA